MMPLWMTAILPDWSVWGCAFGVVGAPCVAQRVCPMPIVPAGIWPSSSCSSMESLPAALWILSPLPLTTAMPDESYPRYSRRRSPSSRRPAA